MKAAAVYFLKDRFIIHPKSTAKAGFWLADEPFVTLGVRADEVEIVSSIIKALNDSKTGLANPTDWHEFGERILHGMGLKSWKVIKDLGTKLCEIELEDGVIKFIPTSHDLTAREAGFDGKTGDAVSIAISAPKNEIYAALQLALSRCE